MIYLIKLFFSIEQVYKLLENIMKNRDNIPPKMSIYTDNKDLYANIRGSAIHCLLYMDSLEDCAPKVEKSCL